LRSATLNPQRVPAAGESSEDFEEEAFLFGFIRGSGSD